MNLGTEDYTGRIRLQGFMHALCPEPKTIHNTKAMRIISVYKQKRV